MAWISVTWHVLRDGHKICPICLDMDGYTWTFEIGKNDMNGELVHPNHNVVWNLGTGSLAHGHEGNCRCSLTHEVNVQDLLAATNQILESIRGMVSH